MSALDVERGPAVERVAARLPITGIRNPASLGVARYAQLLSDALSREGIDYRLAAGTKDATGAHYHLANSSRALLWGTSRGARIVVTVHDVVPRTPMLAPLYRVRVYPQLVQPGCAVIVHSTYAADMLVREAGARPAHIEVIAHPARQPVNTDRVAARAALGWPDARLIAVLPGVIKSAKLAREAVAASSRLPGWQLALVGRLRDRGTARAARAAGLLVVDAPSDAEYERAIVAADCVLCLRAGSVGETNGPLLDAIGAGRAVLGTRMGSIPEVGGDAVRYCDGTEEGVRVGLTELSDRGTRSELERAAADRARALTWDASAAAHAELFREVFDV